MKELNIKYSDWKQNILTTQELEAKQRWHPTVDKEFLPHLMPILAAIPLVRLNSGKISPHDTYMALAGTTIKTINGTISGDELQCLLWCLAKLPRGKLMPGVVQTMSPEYASFTPLVLYAHKLHNNVKYSDWKQNPKDRYLALFIGLPLFEAFASLKSQGDPDIDSLKALELRKVSLSFKSGIKQGQMDLVTSTKTNVKKLPVMQNGERVERTYHKYVIQMKLQTWLANNQCRSTNAMILDLDNWDNIPKPIDSGIPKAKPSMKIIKEVDEFNIDDL